MCKYCKMKPLNEEIGEKSNGNPTIAKIKDGSHVFEVCLNRYMVEEDDTRNNWLYLSLCVENANALLIVKDKPIKIKYCPFCGEEL